MTTPSLGYVAINYISCTPEYVERFEELFTHRAGEIDKLNGFRNMHVLKPNTPNEDYLIVSYWDTEEDFKTWTQSDAFIKGHKRGFADIKKAKDEGKEAPMRSSFKTYEILSN